MKKSIISLLALLNLSAVLSIDAKANDAGCGIGSMVLQKNSKLSQLLAVTVNITTFTEVFGITSGTSNCSASGIVFREKEASVFAEANLPNLKIEMARGEGESLAAFAALLGCQSSDVKVFGEMTRNRYEYIFSDRNNSPQEFLKSIQNEVTHDSYLSARCKSS